MDLIEFPPITLELAQSALLLFVFRVIDVSIATLRLIMVAQGQRSRAAALGFIDVSIWIVAGNTSTS